MRLIRPPVAFLAVALALGSCLGGDNPTDVREALVRVALQPALIPSPADASALPIHRIRAVVTRAADGGLLRERRFDVSPTAPSWAIDLDVPAGRDPIMVVVYLYLLNVGPDGTETVQFSGRTPATSVTAGAGVTGVSADIVRGPLENLLVSGVSIDAHPDTIIVGASVTLSAATTMSGPGAAVVFWTALNPAVVSAAGAVVSGVAPGTGRVVASAGAFADTARIVVIVPPVDSVRVLPDSADVVRGSTRTYTAELRDSAGNLLTGRSVFWSATDTSVATVTQAGVVNGVAPGTTRVRATSEGRFDEAVVQVVRVPVRSVLVSPDSAVIQAGSTTRFTAETRDSIGGVLTGRPVTWTVGDTTVAGINFAGVVLGLTPGTTTVRATSEGYFDEAVVRVTAQESMTLVAADRNGHIYRVDEATGAETLVRSTSMSDGASGTMPIGVVSSMSWIPSTDAWWLGTGGSAVCDACILTLNSTTGLGTLLQQVTSLRALPGLAVHPATGRIYTFEGDSGGFLYELNATTGALSTVMSGLNEGSSGKGTTFSNSGLLYVAGDNRLTRIDVSQLTAQLVGTFTFVGFPTLVDPTPTIGEMATRASDGVVFGILQDGGGGGNLTATYLVTIDLTTAVVTNVGVNTNRLDGLAYVPTRLVPPPSTLVALSGGGQSGVAGTALASPFVARLTDGFGAPASGVNVTWSVTAGGGSLNGTTGTTDVDGRVQATLTLGSTAGTNTVRVTRGGVSGSPVTFTATGTPPPFSIPLNAVIGVTGTDADAVDGAGNAVNLVATPSNTGPTTLAAGTGTLPTFDFNLLNGVDRATGFTRGDLLAVRADQKHDGSALRLDLDNDGSFLDETAQPGFGMHADRFVTFDLAVIRTNSALAADQAFTLTGFAGPADFYPSSGMSLAVLADGVPLFLHDVGAGASTSRQFTVPVPGGARYLTFAALVGVEEFGDHGGFAQATLTTSVPPSAWDATADFSGAVNPNGAWSSGWTSTVGGTLTTYPTTTGNVAWYDPAINVLSTPSFFKNLTGSPVSGVPPGMLSLHPGCNASQFSELRWTAPSSGAYLVNVRFFAGDSGDTQGTVLVNGTPVLALASTGPGPAYFGALTLSAGDRVQIVVGVAGDGCFNDSTPLTALIIQN